MNISKRINTKFFLKIIASFIVVLTILFIGAFVFFQTKGKQIVIDKLSEAFERRVDIGSVRVLYPLGISIKNLIVDGYGSVKEVSIGLGVLHLLDNDLKFSSVIFHEPQIVLHRLKDKTIIIGDVPPEVPVTLAPEIPAAPEVPDQKTEPSQPAIPAPAEPQKAESKKTLPLSIDKLVIKNGTVSFFDHSAAEEFQVLVRDIDLDVRHLSLVAQSTKTQFDLNAKVVIPKTQTPAGEIISRGWLNLARKDMKGEFQIKDLDGRAFTPFYGSIIKSDFTNLLADLTMDLESKNNDMTVKGKLQVKDFSIDLKKENDSGSFSTEELILGSLQSMAKGMAIEFNFKTKMDSFKMDSVSFSGNIFSGLFDLKKPVRLASIR